MSTTTTRRPLRQALADAEAFRELFPATCYERWEIAGSVRRRQSEVGDVEHVIIPRTGKVSSNMGLFSQDEERNLLWFHLDALVAGRRVEKHLYEIHRDDGTTSISPRWGERMRGCDFRGFRHEIFLADEANWGSVLAIRTGPADYSQRLVTRLRNHGWRNLDGYVRALGNEQIVPMPDEDTYFRYCGLRYTEPEKRR